MPRRYTFALAMMLTSSGCAGAQVTLRARDWVRVDTEHVTLRTDLPTARAREVAATMQQSRDAFASAVFPCAFSRPSRVEVTIISHARNFEAVGEAWSAGYFQGSESRIDDAPRRIVLRSWDPVTTRQIFQHELAHQVGTACMPSMPIWLNEGIAAFLETAVVDDTSIALGLPPYVFVNDRVPRSYTYRGVNVTTVPRANLRTPEALVAMGREDFYAATHRGARAADEARVANYASAWALVHHLELGAPEVHTPFARYLAALAAPDADALALWQREFGALDLARALATAADDEETSFVEIDYTRSPERSVTARAMSTGEAHVEWARLWWRDGDEDRQAMMREHATLALAEPETRPIARVLLAADASRLGHDAAVAMMREHATLALAEPETRPIARVLLAADASRLGHDAAVAMIALGLREDPEHPRLLAFWLGLEYDRVIDAPDDADAMARLDAVAARLTPVADSGAAFAMLAWVALGHGDAETARVLGARAVTLDPLCWRCQFAHGAALFSAGEHWPSVFAMERAIACVSHDDAPVLAELRRHLEVARRSTRGPRPTETALVE